MHITTISILYHHAGKGGCMVRGEWDRHDAERCFKISSSDNAVHALEVTDQWAGN